MTSNQIQYQKLQEEIRHNQAMEGVQQGTLDETRLNNYRVNQLGIATLKQKTEQERANLAQTAVRDENQRNYWVSSVAESSRHNQAYESETERHNLAVEALNKYDTDQRTAASKYASDVSAAASAYAADQHRASSKYSADKSYSASAYAADQHRASSAYAADQSYNASKYSANLQSDTRIYGMLNDNYYSDLEHGILSSKKNYGLWQKVDSAGDAAGTTAKSMLFGNKGIIGGAFGFVTKQISK